ncbi:hypothetical protein [Riemerella anatipestifer]|nr:hypothetical protein [Riemerella anatipestifer]UWS40271.1 hypothetical protein N1F80_06520 [Riemerella anatipestifer]
MKRIDENLEKAITLNHKNLRAYYVNASYDFYTPEEYGGGAKTEKYLLKAITLNDRTSTSTFSPHWGKELSYGLLIEYYIKKKNKRLAEKYYQESVKKYPNSNYFNRYLKLIDNI